ncbi:helix-turn-helix domain-containing protein [candidate division KSB1 bacterium]|nr:helix-turn-helix domain-containing protein [candidate division KSB1 bacterium]NIR71512.1 helix-turn-helix domain-containing protein [candidate division KSB1 bacterium]NIS27948.1 helix-turn-helix domain-containing protein [candidate division KSB1 bacterium]NIU28605.1 helix-turn-helix domain-containing protein [candidate division KSB1 bacterium]NIU94329.1 helix-turn-helix domain-containing protein [candidate division KSB1 bacterium]
MKLQQHYRLRDVAKMCAVSEKTVYRWVYEGRLKAHRIAGSVRVPRTELLKIIQPL